MVVDITVRGSNWNAVARDLREYEPELLRNLRRDLKDAGEWGVRNVRENLSKPSDGAGPNTGERRGEIAAQTKVAVSFSKSSAGVRITSSARSIPAEHKPILRAYNVRDFRHPVYGTDTWVTQRGSPYFVDSFEPEMAIEARAQIEHAMNEAIEHVARSRT